MKKILIRFKRKRRCRDVFLYVHYFNNFFLLSRISSKTWITFHFIFHHHYSTVGKYPELIFILHKVITTDINFHLILTVKTEINKFDEKYLLLLLPHRKMYFHYTEMGRWYLFTAWFYQSSPQFRTENDWYLQTFYDYVVFKSTGPIFMVGIFFLYVKIHNHLGWFKCLPLWIMWKTFHFPNI